MAGRGRNPPGGGHGRPAKAARAPRPSPPCRSAPSRPARPAARVGRVLAADHEGNPVPPKFDRLLFFDVVGDPSPACAAARGRAAHAGAQLPVAAVGAAVHRGLGPGVFPGRAHVPSPVPPATALSDFEQPMIDDYHLCLHLASDDEPRLAAVEAALTRGAPLPGAKAGTLTSRARCAGGSHGPGSPAPGCPPGTRTSTASRRPAGAHGLTTFHGVQVGPAPQPGQRGRRDDPRRPVRRRHDHARQLHAAAARHLVRAAVAAGARGPHVRAAGHAQAGERVHHRRGKRPGPAQPGDHPLRRDRARPDLRPGPPQRQPDHPPP